MVGAHINFRTIGERIFTNPQVKIQIPEVFSKRADFNGDGRFGRFHSIGAGDGRRWGMTDVGAAEALPGMDLAVPGTGDLPEKSQNFLLETHEPIFEFGEHPVHEEENVSARENTHDPQKILED